MRHWIEKPDETIRTIVNNTFPSYSGRKFKISTEVPSRIDSYWEGGSRTSYVFYELATRKCLDVHTNHPLFERGQPNYLEKLPEGVVLVAHHIFQDKDMGITIYADQQTVTPMLPKPAEIDQDMETILKYTTKLKNTYAGRKHIRFREANRNVGISREDWLEAKERCISKKLLRKNGAITPDGRNAINY